MDTPFLLKQLEHHARVIQGLVRDVSPTQARWKPAPDEWSMLEVLNHLYDEEREDFRAHLDLILHHPHDPWPRIDPKAWVTARAYNSRDLETSVDRFLQEREHSLQWLRGLEDPDWAAGYPAPWGTISAGDMLTAWVAHDVLHLRQLVELKWAIIHQAMEPYQADYAGQW